MKGRDMGGRTPRARRSHDWQADGGDACIAAAAHFTRNGTWVMPVADAGGLPEMPICRGGTPEAACTSRPATPALAWTVLPLLAGTDISFLWNPRGKFMPDFKRFLDGWYLQRAMARFVAAGMTPLAALQTATLNPAKYLRATDSLGTVAPGKVADLVLLDANPLADIWNTAAVRAVVANGRYFDRAALDALRAELERAASERTAQAPRP